MNRCFPDPNKDGRHFENTLLYTYYNFYKTTNYTPVHTLVIIKLGHMNKSTVPNWQYILNRIIIVITCVRIAVIFVLILFSIID